MIEIPNIRSRENNDTYQQKPISTLRLSCEKWQRKEGQRQIERPAIKINRQNRQQLVNVDKTCRQRMLSIETNALSKTPMIACEKQRAWCHPGTMRQGSIEFQAYNHEHKADCQETKTRANPTPPVLTDSPP